MCRESLQIFTVQKVIAAASWWFSYGAEVLCELAHSLGSGFRVSPECLSGYLTLRPGGGMVSAARAIVPVEDRSIL